MRVLNPKVFMIFGFALSENMKAPSFAKTRSNRKITFSIPAVFAKMLHRETMEETKYPRILSVELCALCG
jgi:hypothetical protein